MVWKKEWHTLWKWPYEFKWNMLIQNWYVVPQEVCTMIQKNVLSFKLDIILERYILFQNKYNDSKKIYTTGNTEKCIIKDSRQERNDGSLTNYNLNNYSGNKGDIIEEQHNTDVTK